MYAVWSSLQFLLYAEYAAICEINQTVLQSPGCVMAVFKLTLVFILTVQKMNYSPNSLSPNT